MSRFLKSGLEAIEKSGKVIFDYFEKIDTTYKKNQNNRDLVSEVDIISEQIILETLKKKIQKF
jgi:fructose-1,6-bisphosphatase/inositol monophosphatase family enzyme